MADAVWPPSLPSPKVADLTETAVDVVVRTAMDAGLPKVRRRFTAAPRPISATLALTRAQVATLDTFFVDTLEGGALTFDWIDHRTGEDAVYRFTTKPQYRPLAPRQAAATEIWRATLELEIIPSAAGSSGGGSDDGAAANYFMGLDESNGHHAAAVGGLAGGDGDDAASMFLIPDILDDDVPPAAEFWPGDHLLFGDDQGETAGASDSGASAGDSLGNTHVLPTSIGGGGIGHTDT